ncbi:MAG: diguanylate cyclase domain-containing protein [Gemmatirosa sp.]
MGHWPDAFLHESLRVDSEVLRRARLTVLLSVVLIGSALGYALFYGAVVGYATGAGILAGGAGVAALALVMLRVRPWLQAAGLLVTGALYGVVVALIVCEGGVRALATPLLGIPPILATMLLGRRGAAGGTALGVLTILIFGALEARGVRFPVQYPAAWAARMSIGSPIGLVLCTGLLLLVFENMRAGAQGRADAATAALARMAYHDALTGLANRARFLECLDRALARAHAAGDPGRVAVLLLDLDGFKAVNDTMGHAAGDALLVQVAERLLYATRGCDTVARLGGDEFAVLLDGVQHDADVSVVAERIVGALARPFPVGAAEARVGTSLGMARAGAAPAAPAAPAAASADPAAAGAPAGAGAAVLHHADVAMYRAKALGRGRHVRFEAGMFAGATPAADTGAAAAAVPSAA